MGRARRTNDVSKNRLLTILCAVNGIIPSPDLRRVFQKEIPMCVFWAGTAFLACCPGMKKQREVVEILKNPRKSTEYYAFAHESYGWSRSTITTSNRNSRELVDLYVMM